MVEIENMSIHSFTSRISWFIQNHTFRGLYNVVQCYYILVYSASACQYSSDTMRYLAMGIKFIDVDLDYNQQTSPSGLKNSLRSYSVKSIVLSAYGTWNSGLDLHNHRLRCRRRSVEFHRGATWRSTKAAHIAPTLLEAARPPPGRSVNSLCSKAHSPTLFQVDYRMPSHADLASCSCSIALTRRALEPMLSRIPHTPANPRAGSVKLIPWWMSMSATPWRKNWRSAQWRGALDVPYASLTPESSRTYLRGYPAGDRKCLQGLTVKHDVRQSPEAISCSRGELTRPIRFFRIARKRNLGVCLNLWCIYSYRILSRKGYSMAPEPLCQFPAQRPSTGTLSANTSEPFLRASHASIDVKSSFSSRITPYISVTDDKGAPRVVESHLESLVSFARVSTDTERKIVSLESS